MNSPRMNYGPAIDSFLTNVYELPTTRERLLITEPAQSWHDKVIKQLESLVRLEQGWDGYNALPVSLANANFALRMLERICQDNAPMPQVVPGVSGDLQIEWHTMKGDVELHVKAPNDVTAWHADANGEEELQLTFNFIKVVGWIESITETPIAIAAAAA